jgi:hypothetical protein
MLLSFSYCAFLPCVIIVFSSQQYKFLFHTYLSSGLFHMHLLINTFYWCTVMCPLFNHQYAQQPTVCERNGYYFPYLHQHYVILSHHKYVPMFLRFPLRENSYILVGLYAGHWPVHDEVLCERLLDEFITSQVHTTSQCFLCKISLTFIHTPNRCICYCH